MPAIGFPYNFLNGLSDFWQRFFADADQLEALYRGTAIQIGQAYLDLMSATLGVSLKDAVALDREYYRMIAIREDEIAFVEGATLADNRWAFALPDPVISFASLDNRVIEPTASLEPQRDYDFTPGVVLFKLDPTDPAGNGVPTAGFARRSLDVETGGSFTDTTVSDWTLAGVFKGDTLRILDVGTDGTQRRRADYPIILVRTAALWVSSTTPLSAPATGLSFVILRVPANPTVIGEGFTLSGSAATFAHTRIDHGSVRVFAKGPLGADVVENVDYVINYEHGKIYQLTAWQNLPGPYAVNYTWREEIYPATGVSPRLSTTGSILTTTSTTRVLQIATWAPDALVDRKTLANNFGALIGRQEASTEAYRSFLEGIFQLYILGPVLERIESALNVVLNLPVVRDDGEIYQSTDTSDPVVDRIFTTRPTTGQQAAYEFPKGTPLRTFAVGQTLLSFEPLTTAVEVTDYVQTPNWWYGEIIPDELFSPVDGQLPEIGRRTASPFYIPNVVNPLDGAQVGDPGLIVGADEDGFIPPPGHPVFRHRVAFVLMDRYLKFHTFSVKFDPVALSVTTGSAFAQSLKDLNDLVLSAKPSHTYVFTTPTTFFKDIVTVEDIALSFDRQVGSRVFGPDSVVGYDEYLYIGTSPPVIGVNPYTWNVGDYFKYEFLSASVTIPTLNTVTLPNAPTSPRRRRLVKVWIVGTNGGRRLLEFNDYTVDYDNCTITNNLGWDSNTVTIMWTQLNIGNTADAAPGIGDMNILTNGIDPALIHAAYDPTAYEWDGTTDVLAPRDISMVERALIVSAHP